MRLSSLRRRRSRERDLSGLAALARGIAPRDRLWLRFYRALRLLRQCLRASSNLGRHAGPECVVRFAIAHAYTNNCEGPECGATGKCRKRDAPLPPQARRGRKVPELGMKIRAHLSHFAFAAGATTS